MTTTFAQLERRLSSEIMELLVTHNGGELSDENLEHWIDTTHKAVKMAGAAHEGQLRKSGEPYFEHPLRVAHLAARHWMDFPSAIAALLHDVVEDTDTTLDEIVEEFGAEVALLVNGLTKVTDEKLNREDLKKATYRKQLLAAIKDVRVLCLKFWDRIHNLNTIDALRPEKQAIIAEETRSIYVPLARYLGMGNVAFELDALSLQILYPKRAQRYRRFVKDMAKTQEAALRHVRSEVHHACERQKISAKIKDQWRVFSIAAAKTMRRGLSSVYTLEITVERMMDAYQVLGILHGIYAPIPGKLRDHLNVPSQFGYQALKTTIQAGELRLRVQITTQKLARFNDSGVLAPGFYFRKDQFEGLMHSLMDGESAFDVESLRLASSSISVYTPIGQCVVLPEGSCALDFAFDIHEGLGLHARRALINGQLKPLRTRLLDGDQVQIDRSQKVEILPKWLDWAATPKARNSIRKYLRTLVKENERSDEN